MKNSAFDNFNEAAQDVLDFARCQRPDGSFYGTSGQCRKGSPTGAKEKEAPKGRKSSGKTGEASAKKATPKAVGKEASKAKPAPKATQANVRKLDRAAKAADKKDDAADKAWRKAGSPKGEQQKEVIRLDKEAKALNRAADKMDKEFQKSMKEK